MITSQVVPALIPKSEEEIRAFIATLEPLPEVHIDAVDGVFVPFTSYPYFAGDTRPAVLFDTLAVCSLEVDLMVANPLEAAFEWLEAGADSLVFHVETISKEALAQFAEAHTVTIGIAANNDTPFAVLAEYFPYVDYVQVMGIAEIGAQGHAFDDRALDRILAVRKQAPQLPVSIDGDVNDGTLPALLPLKLDRYIIGSAIVRAADQRTQYHHFADLVRSQQG
jgi:ribulose-phosphate 3-epimerase